MNAKNSQVAVFLRRPLRIVPAACLLASGLLLVSCKNPVPDAQASDGMECVYVRVTGSNLPVKQCRTAEERAALAASEREGAVQALDNLQDLQEYEGKAPGGDSLD